MINHEGRFFTKQPVGGNQGHVRQDHRSQRYDASRHSNRDLPTLVMGGGFNHQGHLAFDPKDVSTPLLGDLYLTIMQKLGMEVYAFSNAHRNLNGKFS